MDARDGTRRRHWWDRRRYAHASTKERRWPRRLVAMTATVCILVGTGIFVQIYRYHVHSNRVGGALIRHEQRMLEPAGGSRTCRQSREIPNAKSGPTVSSGSVSPPGGGLAATPVGPNPAGEPTPYGLLEVPTIGLVAPIVSGTDAAELSVAVGHVTASTWPGPVGTSVLEGHDVTWFSRLDQLHPGAAVTVATPCATFVYRVQTNAVVAAGTPVLKTATPRLVLVTCYPLDALSLTTQRLVVTADLTDVVSRGTAPKGLTSPSAPVVPAPAPLVAQGLGLAHNPAPMGTLAVQGTPSLQWRQGPEPLADEGALISLYFAALRSGEQAQPAWWASVAPSVPFSAARALVGADVVHNDSTFSPVLNVTSDTFTGASLSTEPVLAGGASPGRYQVTMSATVSGGKLVVTGWTMQHL